MESGDPAKVAQRLAELREEHRDLDQAINRLAEDPYSEARPLAVCPDMASFAEWAVVDRGQRRS